MGKGVEGLGSEKKQERIKALMKSGGRQKKLNSTLIWLGIPKHPQQRIG